MTDSSGVSIFIPVYNEESVLESSAIAVYKYLGERAVPCEIVVVDNGSTDSTITIGERLATENSWFRFFTLDQRGAGKAFARGVKEAKYNAIITLDADLSSDLVFLDYAIDLLKYSEMVVGSKTMGDQRRSPLRIFGSQLYILCTQLLLNLTLSDYSIGCKAYQRSKIIEIIDGIDPWTGYTLDLAVFLKKRGGRIVQVGINCDDKRKSRFNLLHEGWYRFRHLFRVWKTRSRDERL